MNANSGDVDNMAPTACAACKHQRKRCDQHCPLARYFPPSKTQDYFNCHDLFGANNFIKVLNSVEDHKRDETAATLIYEAALWRRNPMQGSIERVRSLQEQIVEAENELGIVNEQVSLFKNSHSEVDRLEGQLNKISLEIIPSSGLEQNVEMNPPPGVVENDAEMNPPPGVDPPSGVEENGSEMNPPLDVEEENGGEMNSPLNVEEENGGEMSPTSCVEEEESGGEMSPVPQSSPPFNNN